MGACTEKEAPASNATGQQKAMNRDLRRVKDKYVAPAADCMQPVLKVQAHEACPLQRPQNMKRWGSYGEEDDDHPHNDFRMSTVRRETIASDVAEASRDGDDDHLTTVNIRAVAIPRNVHAKQTCIWITVADPKNLRPQRGEFPADLRPINVSGIRSVWWVRRGAYAIRSDDLIYAQNLFALTQGAGIGSLADVAAAELDLKVLWFRHEMAQRTSSNKVGLTVTRGDFLESIKTQLRSPAVQQLSMADLFSYKWMYQIKDETVFMQDAGGVTREVVGQTFAEIFDPERGMFKPCSEGPYSIQQVDGQLIGTEEDFYVAGLMMGKAMMDGNLIPYRLSTTLRKRLLHTKIKFQDIQATDHEMFNSLKFMLANPGAEDNCLVFAYDCPSGKSIPLKPGGEEIDVTDENKFEYVELLCNTALHVRDKAVDALRKGLHCVVPGRMLSVFTPNQFEILLNGVTTIDVQDWQEHTLYKPANFKNSQQVAWFWELVTSMSEADKCQLLLFATASSHLPVEGFAGLTSGRAVRRLFQLTAIQGYTKLPQAHTCFNTIELPQYLEQADLESKLRMAMLDSGEGFFMEE